MTVYLVGAGPGDPGLLTVRGAEVLRRADVVVYDRLSVASLLDLAPARAERISVGKTPRSTSTPQEEINALLVERGRAGLTVVRLKGGDPFVFGRGGEEALALAEAGVDFEVVPGITSAIAAPAYAGVPVTHRGLATTFTVVTGHEAPWAATETDWDAVAHLGGTIVVLMGVATRGDIAARLIAGGVDSATPVAAVQWGTRPEQRTVRTTLGQLAFADIEAPATIVIGSVAGLPDSLGWFEQRPLFRRRVLVPRAAAQAGRLSTLLADAGADVVEAPAIETSRVAGDWQPAGYDWIALTSRPAVDALASRLRDARDLAGVHIAAVGPGTAEALRDLRIVADLVPATSSAEGLVAEFPEGSGRVLLPQAERALPTLVDGLRDKGWSVETAVAYRTLARPVDPTAVAGVDAVCFTSGSTVDSLVDSVGVEHVPPVVVCIGPTTAEAARSHGLPVAAVADPHTLEGLVAATISALAAGA